MLPYPHILQEQCAVTDRPTKAHAPYRIPRLLTTELATGKKFAGWALNIREPSNYVQNGVFR